VLCIELTTEVGAMSVRQWTWSAPSFHACSILSY